MRLRLRCTAGVLVGHSRARVDSDGRAQQVVHPSACNRCPCRARAGQLASTLSGHGRAPAAWPPGHHRSKQLHQEGGACATGPEHPRDARGFTDRPRGSGLPRHRAHGAGITGSGLAGADCFDRLRQTQPWLRPLPGPVGQTELAACRTRARDDTVRQMHGPCQGRPLTGWIGMQGRDAMGGGCSEAAGASQFSQFAGAACSLLFGQLQLRRPGVAHARPHSLSLHVPARKKPTEVGLSLHQPRSAAGFHHAASQ